MSVRPTTVDAVHKMLEARAHPKMLTIPGDTPEQKNWPYLLGMCEAMLADANTEIQRLQDRLTFRLEEELHAHDPLCDCDDCRLGRMEDEGETR